MMIKRIFTLGLMAIRPSSPVSSTIPMTNFIRVACGFSYCRRRRGHGALCLSYAAPLDKPWTPQLRPMAWPHAWKSNA